MFNSSSATQCILKPITIPSAVIICNRQISMIFMFHIFAVEKSKKSWCQLANTQRFGAKEHLMWFTAVTSGAHRVALGDLNSAIEIALSTCDKVNLVIFAYNLPRGYISSYRLRQIELIDIIINYYHKPRYNIEIILMKITNGSGCIH